MKMLEKILIAEIIIALLIFMGGLPTGKILYKLNSDCFQVNGICAEKGFLVDKDMRIIK